MKSFLTCGLHELIGRSDVEQLSSSERVVETVLAGSEVIVDIGGHQSGQLADILGEGFVLMHNPDVLDAVRDLRSELIDDDFSTGHVEGEVGELHLEANVLGTGAPAYLVERLS